MALYLSANDISKTYDSRTVIQQATLLLNAGKRVGLVGANGVGKSTLLKIIIGEVTPDGGAVMVQPGMKVGYLAQTITGFDGKTLDALIAQAMAALVQLEARLRALEQQMTDASGDSLDAIMAEYGDLTDQFERYGGYEMDSRVDTILDGLQIGHIPRERRFETLSGGEKARFGLAMLLLQAPDVLLLDEPTNHLDAQSLTWLEGYLQAYRGAILVVSHDRHFLNCVVNVIVEIDEHTRQTRRYVGDYDAYHRAKTREREQWQKDYADQQEEIKRLRHEIKVTARRNDNYRSYIAFSGDKFLRNFKKAGHDQSVSKRVRSAEEKLRRIEADPIPKPPEDLQFSPDFDPQMLRAKTPLYVSGLNKAYGDNVILREVAFSLALNSRVVIVGPNGAGKSTLVKILVGDEPADDGAVVFHPAARIGYLDQEQRLLDPDLTLFEAYREGLDDPDQTLKAILLRSGLFRYDELDKRVGEMSAGQQRKLQIARMIAQKANLLILDEPTNYVSFDVLEAFEAALRHFPGPVLAVSHDRRFIETFDGDIWHLVDGALVVGE